MIIADLLTDSLENNEVWVNIKGNSMAPLLKEGTSILVKKTCSPLYADILVYKYKDDIISHRLIRRRKGTGGNTLYQTKADNGYCLDESVGLEDILGKVIAIKRDKQIVKIDTFLWRIKAMGIWAKSILKVIIYKYAKIRNKI